MADYFGNAQFTRQVVFVGDPPASFVGYSRRVLDGGIYWFWRNMEGETPSITLDFEFNREPGSVIKRLRQIQQQGLWWVRFNLDYYQGYGMLIQGSINNLSHISGYRHPRSSLQGSGLDFWNGRLKVMAWYVKETA